MAADRFIHWKDRKPTRAELHAMVEDFIGEAGTVTWDGRSSRLWITLVGRTSNALRRAPGVTDAARALDHGDVRAIEVYWGSDYIDVMTRMADQFTNAVAAGLAERVAGVFDTDVEV